MVSTGAYAITFFITTPVLQSSLFLQSLSCPFLKGSGNFAYNSAFTIGNTIKSDSTHNEKSDFVLTNDSQESYQNPAFGDNNTPSHETGVNLSLIKVGSE